MRPDDPRCVLLQQLSNYRERYPEEAAVVERFVAFVEAHQDCYCRELPVGHLTGSAWVIDAATDRALLLKHRKLGYWLQPGGHADGDSDLINVARREVIEETGLIELGIVASGIFDIDIHRIATRGDVPEHFHYDVRFLFSARSPDAARHNEESTDMRWVSYESIAELTTEESIRRMAVKWRALGAKAKHAVGSG